MCELLQKHFLQGYCCNSPGDCKKPESINSESCQLLVLIPVGTGIEICNSLCVDDVQWCCQPAYSSVCFFFFSCMFVSKR